MEKAISSVIAIVIGITVGFIAPLSVAFAIGSGVVAALVSYVLAYNVLVRVINQDIIYIRGALKLARKKNSQIQSYSQKWKMWRIWFKVRYIQRMNGRIITTIQKHPDRFQKADKFFSLYLDSTLNVLEKYDMLVHQPVRTPGLKESMKQTELMLNDVVKGLERQLEYVLEDDIKALDVEKEVLRQHQ